MPGNEDAIAENVIEISTMSDEEVVLDWASHHKVSRDATEKLFKEGFTSMEAMMLLEEDDLSRTKIPRGQQKLILAAVSKLLNSRQRAEESAHVRTTGSDVTQAGTPEATTTSRVTTSDQSALAGSQETRQDGGAHQQAANNVDAFTLLLNNLQTGQSVVRNTFGQSSQDNSLNGPSWLIAGNANGSVNSGNNTANSMNNLLLSQSADNVSHSWRDPQIFLESAASGKSAPMYYDITDFIGNQVEEEIVVGGSGATQVVLKSGPRKPKLENVTLAQWSVANLAILYKLVAESKLHAGNILDYLSYTTKVCQLVQRYTLISVLLYDRQYRQLQARHGFRWGTDVPHFHTIHLQPRTARPTNPAPHKANTAPHKSVSNTAQNLTLDGKVICKLYNSKAGCHYKECKFVHQCSNAGCHQFHSAQNHTHSKN